MIFANPRTLVRDLAGAIIANEHFARNGSGVLYVYRGGVYRPDGEMLIRQRVKHLLLDDDCSEMWSRRSDARDRRVHCARCARAAGTALNRADQC